MSDKEGSHKVFLHNLPYGYEKRDFEDLFSKYKLAEFDDIDVMRDRGGRAKGMWCVTLKSWDDVEDAIKELNEVEVDGRKITCREDRGTGYVHPASIEKSERREKGKGKGKKGKGWGKPRWDDWGYDDRRYDRSPRRRGGRDRDDSRDRGRGGRDRDSSRRRDDRDRSRGRDRRRSRSR